MRKRLIAIALLLSALLVGCKHQPKKYGNVIDWSEYESADFHVICAMGNDGFYSDVCFVYVVDRHNHP